MFRKVGLRELEGVFIILFSEFALPRTDEVEVWHCHKQ